MARSATGFPEQDARRVARATQEWERTRRNPPARRRGWRPQPTISAVLRVTSTTQAGSFYPGIIQEYDASTDTWSDVTDGEAWVVGANAEALVLQRYICDLVGEDNDIAVWATACCSDVGTGSGSGGGPADTFPDTLTASFPNTASCPCLAGLGDVSMVRTSSTYIWDNSASPATVTCNGLTTTVIVQVVWNPVSQTWMGTVSCANDLHGEHAIPYTAPSGTPSNDPVDLTFDFTAADVDGVPCCDSTIPGGLQMTVTE